MILNDYKNLVNPMPYIFGMFILGTITYGSFNKYKWLAIFIASCFIMLIYFLKDLKTTIIMILFLLIAVINNSFYFNYTPGVMDEITLVYNKPYLIVGESNGRRLYLEGSFNNLKVGDRIIVKGEFAGDLEINKGNIGSYKVSSYKKLDDNFKSKLYKIREKIFFQIQEKIGYRRAALVSSIAFGYVEFLDEEDKADMKNLGLLHAVSVSGLHMALVYGLLRKTIGKKYTPIVAFLYVIFTGAAMSTMRAYLMLVCTTVASPLRRNYNPIAGISLAGIIILVVKPYGVFDLGFILSFLATIGIILFNKKINKKLYKLPKFLREGLAITLSAQILAFPAMILVFKEFSLNFIIGNIVLAPIISGIVIIGNLIVLTFWNEVIFNYLCFIAYFVTKIMDKTIEILDKFTVSTLYLNENICLFYLTLLMSFYFYKKGYKKFIYMPVMASVYIFILIYSPVPTLKYYREGAYLISYKGEKILIVLKKEVDLKRLKKICGTNNVYKSTSNIKIGKDITIKKSGDDYLVENLNKTYLLKLWRGKKESEYDIIDFSKGDFNEIIMLENKIIPLD
ncbi:MAG: ComEC/Rec2 family competence protein [Clostridium sp.]